MKFKLTSCSYYLGICLACISLSACNTFTPHALGISDAEWTKINKNKQNELRTLYYTQQERDVKMMEVYKKNAALNFKNRIQVRVFDGTAIMPPFTTWYSYQITPFIVIPGTCVDHPLQKIPGKKDEQIMLRACYQNGTLFLDPSKIDQQKMTGTITFHYSPIWDQGFTYQNVNTSGYVRLKNASVEIKID